MKLEKKKPYKLVLGFRQIQKPKFMETLIFPAEAITSMDSEQVSDLHAKYTLLYAYANQEMATVTVSVLRQHQKRNIRENQIFRRRPAINRLDKWRRENIIEEDHQIEQIRSTLSELQIRKEVLQMLLVNYEKFIAALSRELSRKMFEKKPEGF